MGDTENSPAREELLEDLFDFPGIFTFEDYTQCFDALGDAERMTILHQLTTNGPLTPDELAHKTDRQTSEVTEQCEVLVDAGLITRQIGPDDGETIEQYDSSAIGDEFLDLFNSLLDREREAVSEYTEDN